jgi:phosphonoacetaldehyde dehydrogenase
MNIQASPVRHEQMRIAGRLIDTDERVEVFNPYTNKVIGTVPAARPEHVRDAFARARAFKPKLTRYERQKILLRTAEILAGRKSLRG